jgi:pentapeptide MXKDX repeat protein
MTSSLKILIPAAACLGLCAFAFADVARAEDATQKPDAMSADHMSSDHMSSDHMEMLKSPTKHVMKKQKHMMNPDALSSEPMAPKQ